MVTASDARSAKTRSAALREAIELARANVEKGGRPFGAVIARDGNIVARGVNEILSTNDPTAHAELMAIRAGPFARL